MPNKFRCQRCRAAITDDDSQSWLTRAKLCPACFHKAQKPATSDKSGWWMLPEADDAKPAKDDPANSDIPDPANMDNDADSAPAK